ncbi:MAG: hypothetical protein EOS26_22930 [Mesorhizobium sp.]|nr:MAG: hypothetical protein EOS26_22930 [Mesorhizobium sp.]
MIPKIGIDFRKGSYAKLKCYSVLCASNRTRGAVVHVAQCIPSGLTRGRAAVWDNDMDKRT